LREPGEKYAGEDNEKVEVSHPEIRRVICHVTRVVERRHERRQIDVVRGFGVVFMHQL